MLIVMKIQETNLKKFWRENYEKESNCFGVNSRLTIKCQD